MDGINSSEQSARPLTKSSYYQDLKAQTPEDQGRGLWVKSTDSKGDKDYFLDTSKLSQQNIFTTVKTNQKTVKVPLIVKMISGEKITLKQRVETLMESYKQAVVDSKSHNLIMAKINGLKLASLAHILAKLGVPESELRKLRKAAIEEAVDENRALMKENIFNSELLEIVEGTSKAAKTQRKVLKELETQILTQAERLGIDGLYTKELLLELRIESIKEILSKFKAEQQNLIYELEYLST